MAETTKLQIGIGVDTREIAVAKSRVTDLVKTFNDARSGSKTAGQSLLASTQGASTTALKGVKSTGNANDDLKNAALQVKFLKETRSTAEAVAQTLTTKVSAGYRRIKNAAEDVLRVDLNNYAAKFKDQLGIINRTIPQIPASLQKARPEFAKMQADADRLKRALKDEVSTVQEQKREVDRLRAAYDAQVKLAVQSGKATDKTEALKRQKAMEAGENALTKTLSSQAAKVASYQSQKKKLEQEFLGLLTKEETLLLKDAEATKNLTQAQRLRNLAEAAHNKQLDEAAAKTTKLANIDMMRRQAYALQIASTQLGNYGRQLTTIGQQSAQAFADIEFQALRASAAMRTPVEMTQMLTDASMRASEAIGYFNSADIAKGMYFFASTTGQSVQNVTDLTASMAQFTPIMQAAAITGSDLETTVKGVYTTLAEFGLGTDQAAGFTEKLYYAAQNTAAEMPDFVNSMKMLGPVAAQMGISIDDTMASLMTLADAGIKGTMAGRALRQMFLQLGDPSNKATVALDIFAKKVLGTKGTFKELVFPKGQFIGMKGYLDLMSKGLVKLDQASQTSLLGIIATAAETPALAQLIKKNADSLQATGKSIVETNKGFENAAGVHAFFADSVKKVGESTAAAMGRFNNAVTNIKAKFGEALAPALNALANALASISEKFSNFANANPKLMQLIAGLTVVVGVALTAAAALGGMAASLLLITRVAPASIGVFLKEFGLAKSVVAGATAEVGAAAKAIEEVGAVASKTGAAKGLFAGLAESAGGIGGMFSKALGPLAKMGGLFTKIGGAFSLVGQVVIQFFAGFVVGIFQAIGGLDGLGKLWEGIMSYLQPSLNMTMNMFKLLGNIFSVIFEVGRFAAVLLVKAIEGIVTWVTDFIDKTPALKATFEIMRGIATFIGDVIGNVADAVGNLASGLGQVTDDLLDPQKAQLRLIDKAIADLGETSKDVYGKERADILEQIRLLKIKRGEIDGTTAALAAAAAAQIAFNEFRAGERAGLSAASFTSIIAEIKKRQKEQAALAGIDFNPDGAGAGASTKTPLEKALDLAKSASELAAALYKIDGINLKDLIKRTMSSLSEAMLLAVKYAAPYAKQLSKKTSESVSQFADTVGKIASAIGSIADAAKKMETYKAPSLTALKSVVADMSAALKFMITESAKFKGSDLAVVQVYSDSAQAVVGSIQAAVDAFNSMAKGVYQPAESTLQAVADGISRAVQAFVAKVSSAPTEEMLTKIKSFADAANATVGVISAAVDAFKNIRNFVKPLDSDLQSVVDSIETSIRKMIVAMGKFSLTKEQLDVVNTFAGVAKAIADAISGTYDAYVKQFDFVQQFRTEIDYEKVFGWIEIGMKKMADIAGAMPVGMVEMAKDAADAASAIAGALNAFFELATKTGGQPDLVSDSLLAAVNSVLAIIEAFANSSATVGASFVDSLIGGMQSRESALAAEAARLTAIMGTVGGANANRSNTTMTINHVIKDPDGVLKNASATEVAAMLNGDTFISNLKHSINTQ